jgi:ribosomal protein L23
MKIFINGLQRTGTNYALKLFQQNLPSIEFKDDTHNPYYHKHDLYNFKNPFTDKYPDKILTIIKHPYSWVESICFRNCVDIKTWFPNYYLHNAQDYCGPFKINLKNLCKLYYDWYTTWIDVPQVKFMQYERLLTERDVRKNIIRIFNIHPKRIVILNNIPQSHDFVNERKELYKDYKTQYLNDIQKQIIKDSLPKAFLKRINYTLS